jgi:uncharacterized MnhB-related membrane protein
VIQRLIWPCIIIKHFPSTLQGAAFELFAAPDAVAN